MSTCSKCGGHSFKIEEQSPAGSRYKYNFVQCSSCGVPVGVMDYFNNGAQLEDQKQEIASLSTRLSSIESTMQRLVQAAEWAGGSVD